MKTFKELICELESQGFVFGWKEKTKLNPGDKFFDVPFVLATQYDDILHSKSKTGKLQYLEVVEAAPNAITPPVEFQVKSIDISLV
jgi:hypothetical protein